MSWQHLHQPCVAGINASELSISRDNAPQESRKLQQPRLSRRLREPGFRLAPTIWDQVSHSIWGNLLQELHRRPFGWHLSRGTESVAWPDNGSGDL